MGLFLDLLGNFLTHLDACFTLELAVTSPQPDAVDEQAGYNDDNPAGDRVGPDRLSGALRKVKGGEHERHQ